MISHIDIKNFAIIKDLSLDLNSGLNIITGETGAGKSIVIEAISMALGSRADTDYIRTGEDKAQITMLVDTDDIFVDDLLEEFGIEKDNPLVLSRDISSAGKSLCRINGTIVPLSSLNKLCKRIADIHGQYDHQTLLDPDNHLPVLDLYGGNDVLAVKEIVKTAYASYMQDSSELAQIKKHMSDSERQKDLLRFELSEIESADLHIGEDEELESNIKLMENAEKIYSSVGTAREALFSSDSAAISGLSDALNALQSISGFSANLDAITKTVEDAYYSIDDINSSLRQIQGSISFSEDELNNKIESLNAINALKRKFGGSIENVLKYAETAKTNLNNIENADERIADLERSIKMHKEEYDVSAARLTALRKQTADILQKSITKELSELNFRNAEFAVCISPSGMSSEGSDTIEFMISANKGEALRPLSKVASGGELSRVMLALKRIIGDTDKIPTLIFDEIDTGISGATAGIVGSKLKSIADNHQVICITHLPQIACLGDHHYRIEKTTDETSTSTTVVPLNEYEKVEEIARLLSGEEITEAARTQAKELLNGKH